MTSLLEMGILHADPNPGNYAFRINDKGEVNLIVYDFGASYRMSVDEQLGFGLLLKMLKKERGDALAVLCNMGFKKENLLSIQEKILPLLAITFEPLLLAARYPLDKWKRSERVKGLLGAKRWEFMVAAPPACMPFIRGLRGLYYYCGHLGGDMFVSPQVNLYLEEHKDALAQFEQSLPEVYSDDIYGRLEVKVMDGGMEKVNITFASRVVENVEELMDDKTLERLEENGIDLEAIKKRARENAYRPMPLLEWEEGEKKVFVAIV
ncbi:MAG: hypothetical protein HQL32_15285 [Planctomycetes bacterium]|nr:hypothetical protein [Planctomycetota bacterium]